MKKYIMALDLGTTSCRCILFNKEGKICSMAQKEFPQIYPQPGWVEHDAEEIWATQNGLMFEAMSKVDASFADIAGIGITNQRETTVVWNTWGFRAGFITFASKGLNDDQYAAMTTKIISVQYSSATQYPGSFQASP